MAHQLFHLPKAVNISTALQLQPGAKANFYATGTTTPQNTYQNSSLTTPHANPVIADAAGVLPAIYLDSSLVYRLTLTDANDVLIYTVDPVNDQVLSQAVIGSLLYPRTAAEIAAGVTPTNYAYEPGDVRRYGAVGDGTADDTTPLQNALLCNHAVYIPNGTFRITASLDLDDDTEIVFESRQAVVRGNLTAPLMRGRNGTTQRRFHIIIRGGKLDNTSRSNAGGIGLDFLSTTRAKVYGTFITNVETGVRNGGTGALGAFYNEFYGVDITTVVTGYNNGTLGNDNKVFGGRVNDCTDGTIDNNNSSNSYFGLAVEVFTRGHRNSNSTVAVMIRYIGSRLENLPTSGTGFDIGATAQDTFISSPYFTGLTTDINDGGLRTNIVGASEFWKIAGGSRIRRYLKVTVTRDIASLGAGAFRQEGPITVTGAAVGDACYVTLPAAFPNNIMVGGCIITAVDTVFVLLHNPSGAAVDPASMDYVFTVVKH